MSAATSIEPDYPLEYEDPDDVGAFPGEPVTLNELQAEEIRDREMAEWRAQAAERARIAKLEREKADAESPFGDLRVWIEQMQARPWFPCKVCSQPNTQTEGGTCGSCQDTERERRDESDRMHRIVDGFPTRYQDARFGRASFAERVHDAAAVAKFREALTTKTKNFVLLGRAGSGKTTAACAAAFDLAARLKYRASFATAFDLGRARASSKLGEEPEVIEDAMKTRIAVIDELGRSRGGHHDALPDVVFARHDADAVTIWTSGAPTVEALEDLLGDAGMSRRILEGAFVVTLKSK